MPVGVGEALTLADVVAVARGAEVEFPETARERVEAARAVIERVVASGETVYGVTTGFGSLADVRIDPSQAAALQLGIVRSHATAVGRPLSAPGGASDAVAARARARARPLRRPTR